MKFRIHYLIDFVEDHFVVEEDTMEDIRASVKEELEKRGISPSDAWSEKLED